MQMYFNALQSQNAPSSIRVSFESNSNVNDEREEQPAKHSLERHSTDDGVQIHFTALQAENVLFSIRVSSESHSNTNDETDEESDVPFRFVSTGEVLSMDRGKTKISPELCPITETCSVEICRKQIAFLGKLVSKRNTSQPSDSGGEAEANFFQTFHHLLP
jgi:hypothetical protein